MVIFMLHNHGLSPGKILVQMGAIRKILSTATVDLLSHGDIHRHARMDKHPSFADSAVSDKP